MNNVVFSYDPATNTWSTFNTLPGPNSAMGVTTGADGRIYVGGGFYINPLNTVFAAQTSATVEGASKSGTSSLRTRPSLRSAYRSTDRRPSRHGPRRRVRHADLRTPIRSFLARIHRGDGTPPAEA